MGEPRKEWRWAGAHEWSQRQGDRQPPGRRAPVCSVSRAANTAAKSSATLSRSTLRMGDIVMRWAGRAQPSKPGGAALPRSRGPSSTRAEQASRACVRYPHLLVSSGLVGLHRCYGSRILDSGFRRLLIMIWAARQISRGFRPNKMIGEHVRICNAAESSSLSSAHSETTAATGTPRG